MVLLYEVQLSSLFSGGLSQNLLSSLENISNNLLELSYLEAMAADQRQCLYILTDPIASWREPHNPPVYCVVQVYLEGHIPNISTIEDDSVGVAISKAIRYDPCLRSKSLFGARIVHLFEEMNDDAQVAYGSIMLDLLARIYDGQPSNLMEEAPLVNPLKKWSKLHYIGVYSDLTADAVDRWETYSLSLFFVGQLNTSQDPFDDGFIACVMIRLLNHYEVDVVRNDNKCSLAAIQAELRRAVVETLPSTLRHLDHLFLLRILRSIADGLIPQAQWPSRKLWEKNSINQFRVQDFVRYSRPHKHMELVNHLVMDLARAYFLGTLPIHLTDEEVTSLLLHGLLHRPSFHEDRNACSTLQQVFGKVVDYYNTLSPEIMDD